MLLFVVKVSFSEKDTKTCAIVEIKTMRKIAKILVAFSEKLNFNWTKKDFTFSLVIRGTLIFSKLSLSKRKPSFILFRRVDYACN